MPELIEILYNHTNHKVTIKAEETDLDEWTYTLYCEDCQQVLIERVQRPD